MSKRVLVVVAHADDEALGCGGTISRHVAEGNTVELVLMTDGVASRTTANKDILNRRMNAAKQAHSILGIAESHFLDFPDNAMDSLPLLQIVQRLEPIVQLVAPSIIYTHFHGDLNIDHRITQQAVLTACRPQPGCGVKEIYGFEVLSSTEWASPQAGSFTPNVHVDIVPFFANKIKALKAYSEEMRPAPHTRSLEHAEALALHRGYSVGIKYAEAFVAYRILR
jgi:LmbE family N-acetylglucosaminyl deacetylase